MPRRRPHRLLPLLLLPTWLNATAAGEETSDIAVLAPTLGRPVFVAPGAPFAVQAFVPSGGKLNLALRGAGGTFPLLPGDDTDLADAFAQGRSVPVIAPESAWRGVYDLVLRADDREHVARRCVALRAPGDPWRLVHLSDMNAGDINAPGFDPRLADEVNLLNPDAILCSGDYIDRTHPDPDRGWREWLTFIERLEAPVILACGDHDDVGRFSALTGASPAGQVDLGPHRLLVLNDHEQAPLADDPEQLAWARRVLATPAPAGRTLVLAHAARPTLLTESVPIDGWIAGGARDWDGQAFRELVARHPQLTYVRTHQASAALVGGAGGVAHYRLLTLDADGLRLGLAGPGAAPASELLGTLTAEFIGPNDGSSDRLAVRVRNRAARPLAGLGLTLRLSRRGDQRPWVEGARLEQAVPDGDGWLCRVAFDLPDKGARQLRAGVGDPPAAEPIRVHFDAPETLTFDTLRSSEGAEVRSLAGRRPIIEIQNAGARELALTPTIMLDGSTVPFELDGDERAADAAPQPGALLVARPRTLRLAAGQIARLHCNLTVARTEPGPRTLQVYLRERVYDGPYVHPVEVVVRD